MAPFVTGDVNPDALEDLVRLCVQLDRLRHHPRPGQNDTGTHEDGSIWQDSADPSDPSAGVGGQGASGADTTQAWEAIERAIIGKAVDLLSGPGGLTAGRAAGSQTRAPDDARQANEGRGVIRCCCGIRVHVKSAGNQDHL